MSSFVRVVKARTRSALLVRLAVVATTMVLVGAGVAVAAPSQGVTVMAGTTTANAKKLSKSTINGQVRIFLSGGGLSSVTEVSYFLDDPGAVGEPLAVSTQAPFATDLINTAQLKAGTHSLLAVITTKGKSVDVFARFGTGKRATGTSDGGTGGATTGVTRTSAGGGATSSERRNVYLWPYNWDSIWNLPLSTTAKYKPANMKTDHGYIDWEDISVDPKFPVKTLDAKGEKVQVHVDPNLEADGGWNNCAAFLVADGTNRKVIQGQPLTLSKGGEPSWDHNYGTGDIYGDGHRGCHGGSALAGLGGDIRAGELPGNKPIRHALKIGISCDIWCSKEGNGFRWPATKADSGYEGRYNGKDPELKMGTLMALPPNFDITQFQAADVRKIAKAMQDYGTYVVDETGGGGSSSLNVQHGFESEFPSKDSAEMRKLYESLHIVTNSTQATPGGGKIGAPRRVACAPPFTNGKGGTPAGKCPVAR